MSGDGKKRKFQDESVVTYSDEFKQRQEKEKLFPCSQCENEYASQLGLDAHVAEKHIVLRRFRCERGCNKTFMHKHQQQTHHNSRQHDNIRKFACKLCPSTFLQKGQLNNHMRRHDNNMFKCTMCTAKCTTSGNLVQHMAAVHKMSEPTHFCPVEACQAAGMYSNAQLTRHMHVHYPNFKFVCEKCGNYAVNQKNNLLRHQEWCGSEEQTQCQSKTEKRVADALTAADISFAWNAFFVHTDVGGISDGIDRKLAKIDFRLPVENDDYYLFIEVDEHQHIDTYHHNDPWYTVVCEQARMLDVQQSLAMSATRSGKETPKVVWIRYNPDLFTVDGITTRVMTTERLQSLINVVRTMPNPTQPLTLIYMFYDVENGRLRIENDPDFHSTMSACISRIVSSSLVSPAAFTTNSSSIAASSSSTFSTSGK
jgi:hypothetical protein